MNEVFIIGKVTEDVKYKFVLDKKRLAKAMIELELLDKTKIKAIGYNEIADYALRHVKMGDIILANAIIVENDVIIKDIT